MDMHLPLSITADQMKSVEQVIKNPQTTILTECTSTAWAPMGKYVSVKRINSQYKFPETVVTDVIEKYKKSFRSAPGEWDKKFLTQLTKLGSDNKYQNFLFSDDQRIILNHNLSYLWFFGWFVPIAKVIGIETEALEKNLIHRSGGDHIKVDDFIAITKKLFKQYQQQLQDLACYDRGDKELSKKINILTDLISQFTAYSKQILKFSGANSTLGEFRAKARCHAHFLIKKLGQTEKVLRQQSLDVFGNDFDKFRQSAKQVFISGAYNALDSNLLTYILNDKTENSIVVYAGFLHSEFLEKELVKHGYAIKEKSSIAVSKNGKYARDYNRIEDYFKSVGITECFSDSQIAIIDKELMCSTPASLLAPIKKKSVI